MNIFRLVLLLICISITTPAFSYFSRLRSKQQIPEIEPEAFAYQCLDSSADYFPSLLDSIKNFPHQNYFLCRDFGIGSFWIDVGNQDVIKTFLERGWVWEPFVHTNLHQYVRPGSVVVNVGAHIGTHMKTMSERAGPRGCVYAFEPQPKIFRELFMNLILNRITNVKLYPIGIGNIESSIELRPLVPGNEGGTGLGGVATGQFVPLKPLDSFHLGNVSVLKIDVEGMEYEVLEGAKNTILTNRPVIIIEIEGGSCYESASEYMRARIDQTVSLLKNYGYTVHRSDGFTPGGWAACWDYIALPN